VPRRQDPGPGPLPGGGRAERLDVALVRGGFFPSRQRAAAAVLAGQVTVDGVPARRPGQRVPPGAALAVRGPAIPYVSRGGVKLAAALDRFGLDPAGLVCLDAGASTGGFTDVLLRRGAARVYAVDVGYGQLAWALRTDPRVVVLERVNARYLTARQVPEPVDLAVADLSFISFLKVLPALGALVRPGPAGAIVPLLKPQFEAGPGQVGKGGVVRDPEVHRKVLRSVLGSCAALGWVPQALMPSPIRGADGNREFLALLRRVEPGPDLGTLVEAAVAEAWRE
jgi:23S rRNA (cytidine1920-2'-O)/16S rRNA (cytidine1409-2'-O)-methyltransferase